MSDLEEGKEVWVRGTLVRHFQRKSFSAEAWRVKFRSDVYSHAEGNEVLVRVDDVKPLRDSGWKGGTS